MTRKVLTGPEQAKSLSGPPLAGCIFLSSNITRMIPDVNRQKYACKIMPAKSCLQKGPGHKQVKNDLLDAA